MSRTQDEHTNAEGVMAGIFLCAICCCGGVSAEARWYILGGVGLIVLFGIIVAIGNGK